MFVKAAPPKEISLVSGQTFNPLPFGGKLKRFIPIRPRCWKYLNTFRINRLVESSYKPKIAPKAKIDLKKIIMLDNMD